MNKSNKKRFINKCIICNNFFYTVYKNQQTCSYSCSNKKRWEYTCDQNSRIDFILNNYISTEKGCWEYQGSKPNKYGVVYFDNKTYQVHRLSYEKYYNIKIKDNILVCHHCDNPPCINPKHLFLGTHSDNAIDSMLKGRKKKKMTFEKIDKLIELAKTDLSYYQIGDIFNISYSTAAGIARDNNILRKSSHRK